ncbi:MAG: carbohydrate-binding protein [Candidatus Yonathbacteria bacterium]|nr:carbohydrate-binding protein [Candidatus Yonathbacteria bacterium]NTW47756.1 carbohydrate-binding protein [Candidatus Yonathbacteria bacterium]
MSVSLRVFLLSLCLIVFSSPIVRAQETESLDFDIAEDASITDVVDDSSVSNILHTPKDAVVVASIAVHDAELISQEGDVLHINFSLSNGGEDVQPDIRYAIEVLQIVPGKPSGEGRIVDRKIFDETLVLDSGQTIKREVEYKAPDALGGVYDVRVYAETVRGLPLSGRTVGTVRFLQEEGSLIVDPSSCYLSVEGQPTKYSLSQGVDVGITETLVLTCPVNNRGDNRSVIPYIETYERTVFGNLSTSVQSDTVSLPNGLSTISLVIPLAKKPQSYDVKVSWRQEGSEVGIPVVAHYVLQGDSATVQNIRLDKRSYEKGDVAIVSYLVAGITDQFDGSRAGDRNLSGTTITLTIADESGARCADDAVITLTDIDKGSVSVGEEKINIARTCENARITALISDGIGNRLDEYTVSTGMSERGWFFWVTLFIVLILTVVFVIVMKKKQYIDWKKLFVAVFFLVLILGGKVVYGGGNGLPVDETPIVEDPLVKTFYCVTDPESGRTTCTRASISRSSYFTQSLIDLSAENTPCSAFASDGSCLYWRWENSSTWINSDSEELIITPSTPGTYRLYVDYATWEGALGGSDVQYFTVTVTSRPASVGGVTLIEYGKLTGSEIVTWFNIGKSDFFPGETIHIESQMEVVACLNTPEGGVFSFKGPEDSDYANLISFDSTYTGEHSWSDFWSGVITAVRTAPLDMGPYHFDLRLEAIDSGLKNTIESERLAGISTFNAKSSSDKTAILTQTSYIVDTYNARIAAGDSTLNAATYVKNHFMTTFPLSVRKIGNDLYEDPYDIRSYARTYGEYTPGERAPYALRSNCFRYMKYDCSSVRYPSRGIDVWYTQETGRVDFNVVDPSARVEITAASSSVISGQSTTLSWNAVHVNSCTASGSWSGSKTTSGAVSTGPLTQDATYTITCVYEGGSVSDTVNVYSLDQCEDGLDNDGDGFIDLLDLGCATSGDTNETNPATVEIVANPAAVAYLGATVLTWESKNWYSSLLAPFVVNFQPENPAVLTGAPQQPYGGSVRSIPGRIQFEDYDTGGQGVAYNDTTSVNSGGAYRTSDRVDISSTSDTGGGYVVAWVASGEWLEYTVNIANPGTYALSIRLGATSSNASALRLYVDDVDISGAIAVSSTGSTSTYTTLNVGNVTLPAGRHVLKISLSMNSGISINWFELQPVSVGWNADTFVLLDNGTVYGNKSNGYTYGWNTDNTVATVDRNASTDQLVDTAIHTNARTWNFAVPNGTYKVTMSAGDFSYYDSVYVTNVEGVEVLRGTPTSGNRFFTATKTIDVSDGMLTVTNGSGASNNKLNWIRVEQVPSTTGITCTASGGWSGAKASVGTQTVSNLSADTNFTITCSNDGGNVSDSAFVDVAPGPDFGLYNGGMITIPYGSTSGTTRVKVSALNGFISPVTMSITGISPALPTGISVSLTGSSLNSGTYGTGLVVTARVSNRVINPGPYSVTVSGTDGSRTRQTTFALDLSALADGDAPDVNYTEF